MFISRPRSAVRAIPAALLLAGALRSSRALGETDPLYAALRGARPDGAGFAVTGFVLERDVFRFRFESGAFQLLAAAGGRSYGAVFVGRGAVELAPANEAERRQLALETGDESLEVFSDRFEQLVLLFSDGTAEEIARAGARAEPPPGMAAAYERFFKKQRKELKTNLQLRLFADASRGSDPARGLFLAFFEGKRAAPAFAFVDAAGLDWLSPDLGPEDSALYVIDDSDSAFWYLAPRKSEIAAGAPPPPLPARATEYRIETTIAKNGGLRGAATISIEPVGAGRRVFPLHLVPELRIQEVSVSRGDERGWTAAGFVQESEKEDGDAAIVLPQPSDGTPFRARVLYQGKDVLQNAGDGNFLVGARESWYPNLGVFRDSARFELVYRCPKAYQVVSVGRLREERIEGDERVSVWRTDNPIRVAGFNYGKFRKLERRDPDSGFEIAVYTNTGTPDVIREMNFFLEARPRGAGLGSVHVDADGLADSAMADGINMARVGSVYFGPLPDRHVSITQQTQPFFGQSWPSLIYLPYIAALDGTTRRELGLKNAADFVDQVGPHEFAHQWWGHRVGWASYRDQWLSEGFAEFSASLVVQATGGAAKFNTYWEKARRWILEKPRQSSIANDAAGPITQGWRLSTRRNRAAAEAMMYTKGAFVLHMLRMLMRRRDAAGPDAPFIAMMQDFARSFAGKNPSTRDFQTVVERHMTRAMDLAGDKTMDWFFREWVYGMEIPRYREKLDVAPVGDQYRITGSIAQEGVTADFRMPAELYVEFAKGEVAHLGTIPLTGSAPVPVDVLVKLPKPPRRVLVNGFHDVLARE